MTPDQEQTIKELKALDVSDYESAIGFEKPEWAQQCHAVSIALVKSGLLKDLTGTNGRVTRGSTRGVAGQHSWVVLGDKCHDPRVPVLDLTLWSYDPGAPTVYADAADKRPHRPHGHGSIFQWGMPQHGGGETIELTPTTPLGPSARQFLSMLGPLDLKGWSTLAHAPVLGWPAKEIVSAMSDTKILSAFVPIDIVGMLTDRNPCGLYLHPDDQSSATD